MRAVIPTERVSHRFTHRGVLTSFFLFVGSLSFPIRICGLQFIRRQREVAFWRNGCNQVPAAPSRLRSFAIPFLLSSSGAPIDCQKPVTDSGANVYGDCHNGDPSSLGLQVGRAILSLPSPGGAIRAIGRTPSKQASSKS